jgi:formylglycine-generating enzyme required for sulfatase activity
MRVPGCFASFNRGRRLGFWALLLLIFAAVVACQVCAASPVAPQVRTKVNPHDNLTYVWIPPGTFQMGCSPHDSDCGYNENPAHSVALTRGFWIGQTPVTQAAYKKVVGANPSRFKGDQLPVEMITWDNAKAYCEGVDMRLPTEAEWEYAARGGIPSARYGPLGRIAWHGTNSMGTTHEVGQKQANGYGLYDMLGNVWEWVADWYGPYDASEVVDPKGSQTGDYRVLRGGYWSCAASLVRVSDRDWFVPAGRGSYYTFGFRCAGE